MCIFENDTVKSDCPMQENYEIFKDLIQSVGLLFVLEILKKKALKMSFLELFFFFPPSPDPKSNEKKKSISNAY